MLNYRERAALDRHITGNYGADQWPDPKSYYCYDCGDQFEDTDGLYDEFTPDNEILCDGGINKYDHPTPNVSEDDPRNEL